jgi:hypothetical protein
MSFSRCDPSFVLAHGQFHFFEGVAPENKSYHHLKRLPWRFEARPEGRKLPYWVCLAAWQ